MSAPAPGTLSLRWDKRQRDFVVNYPNRPDGWLLYSLVHLQRAHINPATLQVEWEPSFLEELEAGGYDTTTLKIVVRKKPLTKKGEGDKMRCEHTNRETLKCPRPAAP